MKQILRRHIQVFISTSLMICMVLFTVGCGGNGSGEPALQGNLVDSRVEGVHYRTFTEWGITDSKGTFAYREGQTVTFSIGGIELGQAQGISTISPVELVQGASDETNPTVTNICRLLHTLDVDGNPSNDIFISAQIRSEAVGRKINFAQSTDDFSNDPDVQSFLDTLNQMNVFTANVPRNLCDATQAQDHLRKTLLTRLAVDYSGTFTGDDTGTWTATVGCGGEFSGTAYINNDQEPTVITGTVASSGNISATVGMPGQESAWEGTIDASGNLQGTWVNVSGDSGTITGKKVSADTESPYEGCWWGTTNQGYGVSFEVKDGDIYDFKYTWHISELSGRCTATRTSIVFGPTAINEDEFAESWYTPGYYELYGHFTNERLISGTWHSEEESDDSLTGLDCWVLGDGTWDATR